MLKNLRNTLALNAGKISVPLLKLFNKKGTAFPGKLALTINSSFLNNINEKCDKIIIVTGTNGKTTTNNLINHILKDYVTISNLEGANMIQGVATTYVKNTQNHYDYGIFEVDEGSVDRVTEYLKPDYVVLTNFFRDQLDRYGEIEGIINEVFEDVKRLPDAHLIINADDAFINQFKYKLSNNITTYGLEIESNEIIESNLLINKCPLCDKKLEYDENYFGHLGIFHCSNCDFNNDEKDYIIKKVKDDIPSQEITINHENKDYLIRYPYNGLYNAYNVAAAFTLADILNLDMEKVIQYMENFSFSLGRMEEFTYKNKLIKVILTKNPVGLSQVIRIISNDSRSKVVVHILNDNGADGRDVSWIWDANSKCDNDESIEKYYCSGIRAEDIALKKKYDDVNCDKIIINNDMRTTIDKAIEEDVEIVYVLPTYTSIFETRDYISEIVEKA